MRVFLCGHATTGSQIPVRLNDNVVFKTDTPDRINIGVTPGSAVVTINATGAGMGGTGAGTTGSGPMSMFRANPGYNAGGTGAVVRNLESIFFATRTPEKIKIQLDQVSSPTGAAVWIDDAASVAEKPFTLAAAQYAIRMNADTYKDTSYLPYNSLIQQPADGSIQVSDRTLVLTKTGNYLFNMSLATNGTSAIPNIHLIINDANGKRDIDLVNVMPTGMTAASIVVPITTNSTTPAKVNFQVQGFGAEIKIPGNQPQGQLSIVKVG
jgi:hypothetical protein